MIHVQKRQLWESDGIIRASFHTPAKGLTVITFIERNSKAVPNMVSKRKEGSGDIIKAPLIDV